MALDKRDVASRFVVNKQIGPVVIATDTDTDGAAIDLTNYPGWKVLLVGSVGTRTDGTFTFALQTSPDGTTSWDTLAAADGSVAAVSASNTTRTAAYTPLEPFIRVRCTSASTTSGAPVSAHVILVPPSA